MPFYKTIKADTSEGKRTAEGLLRLKAELDKTIPIKTIDPTLLLATWNLREFGGTKSGGREKEPLFYIAEIMSRFDMIAVQEVRENLDALDDLMYILGPWWKYLVSDVTLGTQGNNERHAYIYDTRKLSFGGLVGELVPEMSKAEGKLNSGFAFARTPYLAGFRAGWFKFTICTQHFYYGESKADDPQRLEEARKVVGLLKKRMKSKDSWANNSILLGDFNIFSTNDETFKTLERENFVIPDKLKGTYTNANKDKPFDQIAFLSKDVQTQLELANCGTFTFFDHVYRDSDWKLYRPDLTEGKYKQWRTFKMSDHLPLWVEVGVDFGKEYLERKLNPPL
jgi:endonuclease/exonuclease/phosphatase family metal-dependent hydrolase